MFAKTRQGYGVEKLKAKFTHLRRRDREFSDLIQCSGFGWDPVTNTVISSNEVWDDYINVAVQKHVSITFVRLQNSVRLLNYSLSCRNTQMVKTFERKVYTTMRF